MLRPTAAFIAPLVLMLTIAVGSCNALAQSTAPSPGATSSTDSPVGPPALVAKEIQGLDVFSSDGQQVGKVAKVNLIADGRVKDVEVQSGGFLGFFSKTYVVPAEKLNKKGGRLDLSMTSEQAKQFAR